jgi:hypothetical protein
MEMHAVAAKETPDVQFNRFDHSCPKVHAPVVTSRGLAARARGR